MEQAKLTSLERTLLALVLALSLGLRLVALDAFLTSDEDNWHRRSLAFTAALQSHDWASTYQSGHPGVVTMWLGAAAAQLKFLQRPLGGDSLRQLMLDPAPAPGTGVPPLTIGARSLVALLTWLGVVALYPLLRRLFGRRTALAATALVALDPFLLAHSRLHHLDAVLTTFSTLSIACLLIYALRGRRVGYLLASAVAAALAMANKSPGVLLGPWAALALLGPALLAPATERKRELARAAGAVALWGLVATAVVVAIWPAMWVNPLGTVRNVLGVAKDYAETPHHNLNYFWFAVRPDPGPAFYPLAWAFRTTPWVLLGLVALGMTWRHQPWRKHTALLALWVGLFVAGMTVGEKKFDRYLLPVFPWLDVLAALGWICLLRRWPRFTAGRARWLPAALGAALVAGQLALLWPARPYYISYYNPALGGSRTAPELILVGWGEGLDRAAAYLNGKPGADQLLVSSWLRPEFGSFFVGRTLVTPEQVLPDDPHYVHLALPDYYVFYRSVLQRQLVTPASELFVGVQPPDQVIRVNGIDYAWIYENTAYRDAEQEIMAHVASEGSPSENVVLLDMQTSFARHYVGPIPLEVYTLDREDATLMELQRIGTGRKHVWHLIYPDSPKLSGSLEQLLQRQATVGERLTVGRLQVVRYDLPPDPHFVPAAPAVASGVRFGEQITLVGYDPQNSELVPGQPLEVRFHWQASEQVKASYTVFCHLIGPGEAKYGQRDSLPQAGALPTDAWLPGQRVLDGCAVQVSPDAPPGEYVLVVGLYGAGNHKRLPAYDAAGNRLANDVVVLGGFRVPQP